MLVFFPIGLKDATVSRVPWVCIVVALISIAVHVQTHVIDTEQKQAEQAKLEELLTFLYERPHLDLPENLGSVYPGLDSALEEVRAAAGAADTSGYQRERLQSQLQRMADDLLALRASSPVLQWALVPERGYVQKGLIGYIFIHADWLHLLGNLFFLYLVGPFLEDKWGRLFFAGFFLAGGAMAGAAQAGLDTGSVVPIVGASGAVAACMGAFALRFTTRGVRIFYWFLFIFAGTFTVPAWLWTGFWLAREIAYFKLFGNGAQIAFMAHIGGFIFGAFVALMLKLAHFERLFLKPGLEAAQGVWRQNPHVEKGLAALRTGETESARLAFRRALHEDPNNHEAAIGLARLAAASGDAEGATRAIARVLDAATTQKQDAIVRNVLEELEGTFEPRALRPPAAYRLAQWLERSNPALAVECYRAAAASEGALAGKSLLCAAELLLTRLHQPAEVHALAEVASGTALSAEQRQQLADLVRRAHAASSASYGAEHIGLEEHGDLELVLDDGPPTASAVAPAAIDFSGEVDPAAIELSTDAAPSLDLDTGAAAASAPEALEIDMDVPMPAAAAAAAVPVVSSPAAPAAPPAATVSPPPLSPPESSPPATERAPAPAPDGRRGAGDVVGKPVFDLSRFVGRFSNGLAVQLQQGARVNLSFDLVGSIAFGVVNDPPGRSQRVLVLDLVLPPRQGSLRVLRFFSDAMGLDALFDAGTPPMEALRTLIYSLAERSKVRPPALAEQAARGDYPRFNTLHDFDTAFYG
jgi:membrane associated rhomboid family serine protease